ncbi:hypothetical protein EDB80DRAFT_881705 [Ilyonectria destructans]|nr:hypothetical protein EDB80DRAFT_881705 [Ilyonectria destructans]
MSWKGQRHDAPANRPRLAGGNVAQLLSRFEMPDAQLHTSQSRDINGTSDLNPSLSRSCLPDGTNTAGSTSGASCRDGNSRNKSSSGSSCISPGQLTPHGKPPLSLHRSQTLKATPSTTFTDGHGLGLRHKGLDDKKTMHICSLPIQDRPFYELADGAAQTIGPETVNEHDTLATALSDLVPEPRATDSSVCLPASDYITNK